MRVNTARAGPEPPWDWVDLPPSVEEATPEPLAPPTPTERAIEARRSHLCQCGHPSFGFGPPLTRPGHEVWACGAHRKDVEAKLAAGLHALNRGDRLL